MRNVDGQVPDLEFSPMCVAPRRLRVEGLFAGIFAPCTAERLRVQDPGPTSYGCFR